MNDELTCIEVHDPPLATLYLAGMLSVSSAPRLRSAVLKCLADQPGAVLLDVADVAVHDDIVLTVFAALARQAAAWPAVPILMCAVPPQMAASLRRLHIDRQVIVCPSVADGRLLAARQPLPARIRDQLPPTSRSVPVARNMIGAACARWNLPGLAPRASLVVGELVTNAVCHAGTIIDLVVTRGGRHLHLAVRDYDHRRPRLVGPASETAPGGRGLLVVEAFSTSWGYTPTRDGKVTWASLPIRESTAQPGRRAAR